MERQLHFCGVREQYWLRKGILGITWSQQLISGEEKPSVRAFFDLLGVRMDELRTKLRL